MVEYLDILVLICWVFKNSFIILSLLRLEETDFMRTYSLEFSFSVSTIFFLSSGVKDRLSLSYLS